MKTMIIARYTVDGDYLRDWNQADQWLVVDNATAEVVAAFRSIAHAHAFSNAISNPDGETDG